MADCKFCRKKAGLLRGKHKECEGINASGRREMAAVVAQAASAPHFSEAALHISLSAIAQRSWIGEDGIRTAIAQGWRDTVRASLADGILTQEEEDRLRIFRNRLGLAGDNATVAALAQLDKAVQDRLMLDARLAALAVNNGDSHLHDLDTALGESGLSPSAQRRLLITAWESAVNGAVEDGVPKLDEEAALTHYLQHFNLDSHDVNGHGAHRRLVEAAVIREAAEGIVPQRFRTEGQLPLNLQKSEQLVWAFNNVDYYELKTRRERRGTSHGVSIRIARGLYYSPRQFRSQTHEWDETVHIDTGLLAVTDKHIYFHGDRKAFRVRFDKIVSFEQFGDGFGIMRDAQTAKPQSFRTGDGWFVYNLVTNLSSR